MSCATLRHLVGLIAVAAVAVTSAAGCRTAGDGGRSPSFLIIQTLEGASGAEPDEFGTILFSDVQTLVERQIDGQNVRTPTIFSDVGRVTLRLGLKDPGTATNPNAPSSINEVTVTRYHVAFRRADGRNTPGVDVPYGFDGGITITVPANGTASAGFDIVRFQSKLEPPLRNLLNQGGAGFISTIAEVTFYGRDQAGNDVTVTGNITVTFGDLADPA